MGRYLLGCFPVFATAGARLVVAEPPDLANGNSSSTSAIGLLVLASFFGRAYYLT